MPLQIVRNDITTMAVDAIVNAANHSLLGGGGVDGAIHRAAGAGLLEECKTLGGCQTGQAKITKGYALPCRYVIHTVGPVYQGGTHGEEALLRSCYTASLKLAKEYGCQSVAFPLLSSGAFGYPKDQALKVAVDAIADFLMNNDMTVSIVVFDAHSFQIGEKLFTGIRQYIDDVYADAHTMRRSAPSRQMPPPSLFADSVPCQSAMQQVPLPSAMQPMPQKHAPSPMELSKALSTLDEGFAQALLRLIDERGMTDVECYKRANIDRKLFSKIRSDPQYRPSKPTVLAFAIALKLPLEQAKELLGKAGFALSHSSKFDIIVEYCILHGIFDVHQVNEALFKFDQSLLGTF